MEESKHDTRKVIGAVLVNGKQEVGRGQTLRPFEVQLIKQLFNEN